VLAGAVTTPNGTAVRVSQRGAFHALCTPVNRACAGNLAAAGGFGGPPVDCHVGQFQADDAVVALSTMRSSSAKMPRAIHSSRRSGMVVAEQVVGDLLIRAAEHQDLDRVCRRRFGRGCGFVAAQGVVGW
jgi:hypothetical protein